MGPAKVTIGYEVMQPRSHVPKWTQPSCDHLDAMKKRPLVVVCQQRPQVDAHKLRPAQRIKYIVHSDGLL